MKRTILTILGIAAITAGAIFSGGCDETNPASEQVTISPTSSTLLKGESVALTASGGYSYEWSLSDENKGSLSIRTGSQTTYTSRYEPEEVIYTQVITLNSQVAIDYDSDNSSTSSVSYQAHTTEAYVKHLLPDNVTPVVDLTVTPSSFTVTTTSLSKTFTVSGASNYRWYLESQGSSEGDISNETGDNTEFTHTGSGLPAVPGTTLIYTLRVVNQDNLNQTGTASIYQ